MSPTSSAYICLISSIRAAFRCSSYSFTWVSIFAAASVKIPATSFSCFVTVAIFAACSRSILIRMSEAVFASLRSMAMSAFASLIASGLTNWLPYTEAISWAAAFSGS